MVDVTGLAEIRAQLSDEVRTELAAALADVMGEISEARWCAGWLAGLEYRLWRVATGETQLWPNDDAGVLRVLSELSGYWVVWGRDGVVSVPLAEWRERYATERGNGGVGVSVA